MIAYSRYNKVGYSQPNAGLNQGCPLDPTLFGLFLNAQALAAAVLVQNCWPAATFGALHSICGLRGLSSGTA